MEEEIYLYPVLSTLPKSNSNDYQQLLRFVQRILNSSYNQRTKISPADLLCGNSLDLSGGIYNSIHQHIPNTETQSQSMDKMINMQSKLISISKKNLEDSDREHNSVNSASIVAGARVRLERRTGRRSGNAILR
jgi:hypothetical protein